MMPGFRPIETRIKSSRRLSLRLFSGVVALVEEVVGRRGFFGVELSLLEVALLRFVVVWLVSSCERAVFSGLILAVGTSESLLLDKSCSSAPVSVSLCAVAAAAAAAAAPLRVRGAIFTVVGDASEV